MIASWLLIASVLAAPAAPSKRPAPKAVAPATPAPAAPAPTVEPIVPTAPAAPVAVPAPTLTAAPPVTGAEPKLLRVAILDVRAVGEVNARALAALAFLPARNKVVLFGGQTEISSGCNAGSQQTSSGTCLFTDVFELSGSSWTNLTPPTDGGVGQAPLGRAQTALAADPVRGTLMLFGGNGSLPLNDQWEWTGTAWSKVVPTDPEQDGNPLPTDLGVLVSDPDRARAVLVQAGAIGSLGNGTLEDTWEWNGASWKKVAAVRAPATPRFPNVGTYPPTLPGLAYDLGRRRALLAGGSVTLDRPYSWDGTTFSPVAAQNPPLESPRSGAFVAYLPQLTTQSTPGIVFGSGEYDLVLPANGYLFDGARWSNAIAGFPSVFNASTSYDPDAGVLVVAGGFMNSSFYTSTSWMAWNGGSTVSTVALNEGRAEAGQAFDPSRGVSVLFGGYCWGPSASCTTTYGPAAYYQGGGYNESDVYELNAKNGQKTHIASPPSPSWPGPRALHAGFWDPVKQRVLFVGGTAPAPYAGMANTCDGFPWCEAVWSWNGATWVNETFPDGTQDGDPTRLKETVVAEDPTRGTLVYSPSTGQLWTYVARPAGRRAGVLAKFDLSVVPDALASVASYTITVTAQAGGLGAPNGVPGDGAQLQVWSEQQGAWATVAVNSAPTTAPGRSSRRRSTSPQAS